jgi:hypothetical protein
MCVKINCSGKYVDQRGMEKLGDLECDISSTGYCRS